MGETVKPFPCKSAGCNMTFTNEDHLLVHAKNHDINLHIGIENLNNTSTDQTPTPTRFIRNCEEVGLFQDLQNVNPFDETFRKAAELVNNGSLHVPEKSSDDSLHTPNLFLSSENSPSLKIQERGDKVEKLLLACLAENKTQNSEVECLSTPSSPGCLIISDENELEKDINTSKVQNDKEESFLNVLSTINVKDKLKNVVSNRLGNSLNVEYIYELNKPENIELKIQRVERSSALQDLRLLKKSKITKTQSIESENTSGKSRNILTNTRKIIDKKEMNRAAQFRSRQRKKQWIREMETDLDLLKKENKKLWLENQNLKLEVNALKKVFLLHKDCSVSKEPKFDEEVSKILQQIYSDVKKEERPPKKLKVAPIKPNISSKSNLNISSNSNLPILTPKEIPLTSTPVSLLVVPTVSVNKLSVNNNITPETVPKILTIPPGQACIVAPLTVTEKSKFLGKIV